MGSGFSLSDPMFEKVDKDGIKIQHEKTPAEQQTQMKLEKQKANFEKYKEVEIDESLSSIKKYYKTEENYKKLVDATSGFLEKFCPKQLKETKLILYRYRGMEEKLYQLFNDNYGDRVDYEPIDFDLDTLPYRGNIQTHVKKLKDVQLWVTKVSAKVIRVQCKFRSHIARKRLMMIKKKKEEEQKTALIPAPAKPTKRMPRRKRKPKSKPESPFKVVATKIKAAINDSQISTELLFFMHDEKNTGRINYDHFSKLCRNDLSIKESEVTEKQLREMFEAIDLSHDGELQLNELETFLDKHA